MFLVWPEVGQAGQLLRGVLVQCTLPAWIRSLMRKSGTQSQGVDNVSFLLFQVHADARRHCPTETKTGDFFNKCTGGNFFGRCVQA